MASRRLFAVALIAMVPAIAGAQDESDRASPRRLAVSADGRLVALASADAKVRVWEADSGRLRHVLSLDRPGSATAFGPKGNILVAGTIGDRPNAAQPVVGRLVAWDLSGDDPKALWDIPQIGAIQAIAVEPGGAWCVSVSSYGRWHLVDLRAGEFKRVGLEQGNGFGDAAIAPDGRTLLTVGQSTRIWDPLATPLPEGSLRYDRPATDEESQPYLKARNGAWGTAVAIAPDGTWAAVLGSFHDPDGKARTLARIDLADGRTMAEMDRGLEGVTSLAVSPDGRRIAIGFDAPRVEIRAVDGPTPPRTLDLGDLGEVRSLAFLGPDRLAIANRHGTKAEIRSIALGRRIRELQADR